MRLNFTLILFLLASFQVQSQNISGIWRGYFSSSNGLYREGIHEEMYKYEVQIEQLQNNSIKGVTFSYKTTVFYGKSLAQGIFNAKSKTLLLKETALVDLRVEGITEPCLMTCYLDYSKIGTLEVLQGTFISTNTKDKGDCGSGKVYLERVPTSEFKKEEFLKKPRIDTPKSTQPIVKNTTPATSNNTPTVNSAQSKLSNKLAEKPASPAKKETTNNTASLPKINKEEQTITIPEKTKEEPAYKKVTSIPNILKERENNLAKTIFSDDESILVELYDNGTIDNDTISVYNNNELIVKRGRLTVNPITININNTANSPFHELVIVAENLGEIPPNTALMVVTAGKKRYEIFLDSDQERNAKVIIQYKH
jgi:hypothetical protein